jgi:hypothetical protein
MGCQLMANSCHKAQLISYDRFDGFFDYQDEDTSTCYEHKIQFKNLLILMSAFVSKLPFTEVNLVKKNRPLCGKS